MPTRKSNEMQKYEMRWSDNLSGVVEWVHDLIVKGLLNFLFSPILVKRQGRWKRIHGKPTFIGRAFAVSMRERGRQQLFSR